jgi:hypothetical protein
VISHWLLDLVVHRPDLPLVPGFGVKVGLGLWSSLPGTLVVELALFALGFVLYLQRTMPRDGLGRWGAWGLALFLLVVYLVNLFGPPPPSPRVIAWAGEAQWLVVALGYWIDRHRLARPSSRWDDTLVEKRRATT